MALSTKEEMAYISAGVNPYATGSSDWQRIEQRINAGRSVPEEFSDVAGRGFTEAENPFTYTSDRYQKWMDAYTAYQIRRESAADSALREQAEAYRASQTVASRNALNPFGGRTADIASDKTAPKPVELRPGYTNPLTIGDRKTNIFSQLFGAAGAGVAGIPQLSRLGVLEVQRQYASTTPGIRDDLFFSGEQSKLLQNKVEVSSAYHAWGMYKNAPVAANPFEAQSDLALSLLKGSPEVSGRGQLGKIWSGPSKIESLLPSGLSIQDWAWETTRATEKGTPLAPSYSFFGAIGALESYKGKGPYGSISNAKIPYVSSWNDELRGLYGLSVKKTATPGKKTGDALSDLVLWKSPSGKEYKVTSKQAGMLSLGTGMIGAIISIEKQRNAPVDAGQYGLPKPYRSGTGIGAIPVIGGLISGANDIYYNINKAVSKSIEKSTRPAVMEGSGLFAKLRPMTDIEYSKYSTKTPEEMGTVGAFRFWFSERVREEPLAIPMFAGTMWAGGALYKGLGVAGAGIAASANIGKAGTVYKAGTTAYKGIPLILGGLWAGSVGVRSIDTSEFGGGNLTVERFSANVGKMAPEMAGVGIGIVTYPTVSRIPKTAYATGKSAYRSAIEWQNSFIKGMAGETTGVSGIRFTGQASGGFESLGYSNVNAETLSLTRRGLGARDIEIWGGVAKEGVPFQAISTRKLIDTSADFSYLKPVREVGTRAAIEASRPYPKSFKPSWEYGEKITPEMPQFQASYYTKPTPGTPFVRGSRSSAIWSNAINAGVGKGFDVPFSIKPISGTRANIGKVLGVGISVSVGVGKSVGGPAESYGTLPSLKEIARLERSGFVKKYGYGGVSDAEISSLIKTYKEMGIPIPKYFSNFGIKRAGVPAILSDEILKKKRKRYIDLDTWGVQTVRTKSPLTRYATSRAVMTTSIVGSGLMIDDVISSIAGIASLSGSLRGSSHRRAFRRDSLLGVLGKIGIASAQTPLSETVMGVGTAPKQRKRAIVIPRQKIPETLITTPKITFPKIPVIPPLKPIAGTLPDLVFGSSSGGGVGRSKRSLREVIGMSGTLFNEIKGTVRRTRRKTKRSRR